MNETSLLVAITLILILWGMAYINFYLGSILIRGEKLFSRLIAPLSFISGVLCCFRALETTQMLWREVTK